ncbi:hypothetical protein ECC02_004917 [Trypanosoma cruzi]|uniref:Secreted protein n=1 Tax=Trypanosoma cruzi TaxID=5693 RepID=A0A7J6Y6P0_TRYCR|nr:hypothetical protein ECC02_004917 [Trypanosoma cruzi]
MMRGRLLLLAAPASSAGKKMQMTLCCTHDDRCTLRNGNRILWHHTPQWMRTVSVSLPPFPLPENSSVAVAHSPTCQKALVFLLPSHFEQQHRQTHFTPSLADSPQTRLPPHSSTHRHAVRKRRAAAPHDGAAHTNTAPRHSVQAVSGHTKQFAPANNSPLQAVRQDSSLTIKQSASCLFIPPCKNFCLPHASYVTPGLCVRSTTASAQELICKTLNSFHVNKQCGIMPRLHKNVGWRFPERPPINTARGHSKEKATPPIWQSPAANNKAQSNKMPQIITYLTQTIDSLRGKCTARKKVHVHTYTVRELGKAAPKAILCGCK